MDFIKSWESDIEVAYTASKTLKPYQRSVMVQFFSSSILFKSKSYELMGAIVGWVFKKSTMVHQRIDKVEVNEDYDRTRFVFKKSTMLHQRIDEVEVDEDYDRTRFVSLKSQNIYYGT
ncbi:hypothetical protein H5410_064307 [Solanum commersonii]|uniref:Uncharacterized protein n=1 Tax=Solanum commersonii TaxID=4109 RepID=A0A9J5VZS1_SOLCO|nr:hypothetical protein H5410_064307 [Solanum commersonii]